MFDNFFAADISVAILFIILIITILRLGIKVVPQSEVFVVERFGKFSRTLNAGLSLICLLYTSPSPRDATLSRMPSSA